jgi:GntR family transcriptional regulator
MTPHELSVDRASEVPLGTQLAWRLRTLIATGALAAGERLPAVRELAESAGVNVNTVRNVYARLEEQGLIASEHGRGTFVAEDAPRQAELARVAAAAVEQAQAAGLDPREVAAALFAGGQMEGPSSVRRGERDDEEPPGGGPGERAQRRVLRAEIAELERELAPLEGIGRPPRGTPRTTAGRILTAAELRQVRDSLAERLVEVRAERAAAIREADERQREPGAAPRVWRHAGTWTGRPSPGVVRTASYGA